MTRCAKLTQSRRDRVEFMPGKIFINYRRDDERAMAARMRDRLAQAFGELNVFMDVDNLMAGQRFDKELERALGDTDVFLSVVGPRWVDILSARTAAGERDYVREEIVAALKLGLTVIPILIDQTQLPRADALPSDVRELVLHQKHNISHDQFGRDVAELVSAIKFARKSTKMGRGGAASTNFKRHLVASVAATLCVAGIAIWGWQSSLLHLWPPPPAGPTIEKNQSDAAIEAERKARLIAEAEARRLAELAAKAKRDQDERQNAELEAEAARKASDADRIREAEKRTQEQIQKAQAEAQARIMIERQKALTEAEALRKAAEAEKSAALQLEQDRQKQAAERHIKECREVLTISRVSDLHELASQRKGTPVFECIAARLSALRPEPSGKIEEPPHVKRPSAQKPPPSLRKGGTCVAFDACVRQWRSACKEVSTGGADDGTGGQLCSGSRFITHCRTRNPC